MAPGGGLAFSLVQELWNHIGLGKKFVVDLTAAFHPLEASDFLNFDST